MRSSTSTDSLSRRRHYYLDEINESDFAINYRPGIYDGNVLLKIGLKILKNK